MMTFYHSFVNISMACTKCLIYIHQGKKTKLNQNPFSNQLSLNQLMNQVDNRVCVRAR